MEHRYIEASSTEECEMIVSVFCVCVLEGIINNWNLLLWQISINNIRKRERVFMIQGSLESDIEVTGVTGPNSLLFRISPQQQ